MAEALAPLSGRRRIQPWFAEGARSRYDYDDDGLPVDRQWLDLLSREQMFVPLAFVLAHLNFAAAKTDVGARVALTRLEAMQPADDEIATPALLHDPCLRVDYFDPGVGIAVVTSEDQSQVFTVRLDAITRIETYVRPLDLDPAKVRPLTAVRL